MDDSILTDVKKLLDIDESDDSFDQDVLIHINAYMPTLRQLGVDTNSIYITDSSTKWSDLFIENNLDLTAVKTWLGLKVKKVFDPPQNGTLMEALNSVINEMEWRLNISVDTFEEE